MSEISNLQLKPSAILSVPIQTYGNDFSFIVNGEEFKTSHLVSDLISTTISKIHINDPTMNYFIINTEHKGNFSRLLKLVNFEQISIPENEVPFALEVLDILSNESIEIIERNQEPEITIDNIFNNIEKHQKFEKNYSKRLSTEIDFISNHFSELFQNKGDEFEKVNIDNLIKILSNENLQLKDEDELVKFVNKLYSKNSEYACLYGFVFFENVDSSTMKEFIDIIEFDDITTPIWLRLCSRLQEKIDQQVNENNKRNKNRYSKQSNSRGKFFHMIQIMNFQVFSNILEINQMDKLKMK